MRIELGRAVRTAIGALVIAAVFALISLPGIASLPIDKHEALVVQTSKEMVARDDLLVPYFNDEPRLNKPPMSYWATIATAWLRAPGAPVRIAPLDARIPSILASLATLLMLVLMGRRCVDLRAGLLIGAVYACSPALAFFSHDARPDTLYAFLSFAGTALLALQLLPTHTASGRHGIWLALSGWTFWALATLTKGPHIPLLMLIALVVFGLREGRGVSRVVHSLRPATGIVLMLVIALPWWLALESTLGAETLAGSQLGGTLYKPDPVAITHAYHELLGLAGLLFPWSLMPLLMWARACRLVRTSALARLSLFCFALPVLLLMFSPQHRWHYTLPMIPFLAIFCGLLLADKLAERSDDKPVRNPAQAAPRAARRRAFAPLAFVSVVVVFSAFLALSSWQQFLWKDMRFDRARSLALLGDEPYRRLPVYAADALESAFPIAVAWAERRVELVRAPADLLDETARSGVACAIVIGPRESLSNVAPGQHLLILAAWPERRKTLQAGLFSATESGCSGITQSDSVSPG